MTMTDLKRHVVDVADFPRPGILFRDITPLLRRHFDATLDAMDGLFSEQEWQQIDALGGIESRGFILAAGRWFRRPTIWSTAPRCWKCARAAAGWR
jgi:adenine phosphoribosyltransferase